MKRYYYLGIFVLLAIATPVLALETNRMEDLIRILQEKRIELDIARVDLEMTKVQIETAQLSGPLIGSGRSSTLRPYLEVVNSSTVQSFALPDADRGADLGTDYLRFNHAYLAYVSSTAISAPTICIGTDCQTAFSVYPFTPTTNYGETTSATTSPLWIRENLYVSSTVYLTSVSTTQGIEAAADTNTRFTFGRAVIASPLSDFAVFSHYDNTALANTALVQGTDGATTLNSKSGQITSFSINAATVFTLDSDTFDANDASGPTLENTAASATNPTLIPSRDGLTTGIGGGGDSLSIITSGVERVNFGNGGNISVTDIMFPTTNNTYDLGTTLNAYKNIHVTSTAFLRFVSSTLIEPYKPNGHDLGSYKLSWRNIYASSTSYLSNVTSTSIEPWANNTSDLGFYSRAWKNLYASSTAYLEYVSTTAITAKTLPNSTQTNSLCYNTTNGTISYVSGDVCSISLLKFKENIHPLNTQGKVYNLEPVRFNYKDTGRESIGLIAEEVEKVLPELAVYSDKGELQTVAYDKLPVVLLEEMKKLEDRISELESKLNEEEIRQCF